MNKNLKIAISFTLLCLYTSSSSASDIKINSSPKSASVYLVDTKSGKEKLIGKTPIDRDLDKLIEHYIKSKTFLVSIKKEGYIPYQLLISNSSNTSVDIVVSLKALNDASKVQKRDIMISSLFNAQRLIRSRNFTDGIKILSDLESKFKDYSIISELKASAYYLQGDVEKSLSEYRMAFAKNTKNTDAYKMKVYLEKKLGVDAK